ncbi:DNA-binding MarR family transcriptional regulator [Jatrophihabitans sp. GAS493]|uniref:MarR family winged helix-turn-helix transcriptional regulator n=1 Tax=Jatrophihabitans sp. GAS493 TaxID=1907575 RepID=UPI000BBFDF91|nr:MarR family winged helix-turn-helix transcriptional regulator [Jatrophihabitans sp. GAS493]SOD75131.1 DNA-binding MarR family transcriptional regulator [Jatrophihabitans sp. GAS493]
MTDTFPDVRRSPERAGLDGGPDRTGLDASLASVRALRDLMLVGEQFRQATAEHFGVGVTETIAISYLSAEGPLTPRQLSQRLGLTPSSVTSVLDRLETAGMAERARHATDRRQITITITPYGQSAMTWTQLHLEKALRELGSDRLPDTSGILGELAVHLAAQTAVVRHA